MIWVVTAALAALAAWLWWPGGARPLRRLRAVPADRRRPGAAAGWVLVATAATATAVVAGLAWPAPAVVLWCLGVLGAVAAWLHRSRRRRRRRIAAADEIARACSIIAAECRLGRIAPEALQVAAADVVLLAPAAGVQRLGGDPVPLLRAQSTEPGQSGLIDLARAWQVSVSTGAPMAELVGSVAGELRQLHGVDRLVDGELAAPRATSHVLAALPLAGLALGQSIGAQPLAFLTGSAIGLGCLMSGTVLTGAGLIWSELLAQRAGGR